MNNDPAVGLRRSYKCPPILFTPIYKNPGTADEAVAVLEKSDPEAAGLARAFLLYYRGNREDAAVEAQKLLSAPDCRFETTLGVSHILSLEALYAGDTKKWEAARELIVKCDYASEEEYVLKEINLATLDCTLFVKDSLPEWLCEGCFDRIPAESYCIARYLYAKYLYMEARFSDLAAVVEPLISQSHTEKALLSEIYLRIIAAMGRYYTGENDKAKHHLRRALELALPDGLIAPFAEYRRQLGSILDTVLKEMKPEILRTVIELNEAILAGWTKLFNTLYGRKYSNDLTPREYDVARFALLGISNGEIADKMDISVNTVKLYLRNIYEKLGINKRSELAPYIWEEI